MYFEFEYPYFFFLIGFIICLYLCPFSQARTYFPHLHLFNKASLLVSKEKFLFSLILIFIASSLASPITYEKKSPNNRKGRDLVIAIDCSGSMGESRYNTQNKDARKFDEVRNILNSFILKRYDDNLGVVAFGSFAFALSPLTYDRKSLSYIMDFLDVSIAGENTAIGDGLYQSLRVLKHGSANKKIVILLSDGFQNSGAISVKEAIELSLKEGVKVYTIGIGKKGDFDEELLKQIATNSKGEFFQAENSDELKKVYDEIDSLEPSKIRSQHYLNKNMLFHIPLFLAIALLLFIIIKRKRVLI